MFVICAAFTVMFLSGCDDLQIKTSDEVQNQQQEQSLQQGVATVGMPAITNFTEKKLLKEIYEARDDPKLITYTYIVAENTGKLVYIGQTIGYGLPYATEYTAPQKAEFHSSGGQYGSQVVIPQADPNGLFSPTSAEGTWIFMKDPNSNNVEPMYMEPRIIVSRFKLQTN